MNSEFFKQNREKLIQSLCGGVVVLSAFSKMQRDNDSAFPFIQESNFWWLTGIDEPDCWLIIDGLRHKNYLVLPNLSDVNQVFYGSLSPESAIKISAVDDVLTKDQATRMINDLAKRHSVVHTIFEPNEKNSFDYVLNPAVKKMRERLVRSFNDVQDCRRNIANLRTVKGKLEINMIKKAIKGTIESFNNVKSNILNYDYEYQIEATLTADFLNKGFEGHAFDPIVASGLNACTLHYHYNKSKLKKRDLVLLDIGAKVGGYSSDISRTFSLGEPSARQIQIHKAVNSVRKQSIDLIKPNFSISEYQKQVDEIMVEQLELLGLYTSDNDLRKYFPHSIGHGLGVDTHDSLGEYKYFTNGMVITVEPGIYIEKEKIGVRIEDDILVTDSGCLNLTSSLSTDL